jgi:hypothetical protein
MIKKFVKGIKKFVEDKIKTCKEILSNDKNRLILGLTILGAGIGIGGGLIASAYIRIPS